MEDFEMNMMPSWKDDQYVVQSVKLTNVKLYVCVDKMRSLATESICPMINLVKCIFPKTA